MPATPKQLDGAWPLVGRTNCQVAEHGLDGRNAGACGKEYEIHAGDIAQEEGAARAFEAQQMVGLGLVEPVCTHRAAINLPDVQFEPAARVRGIGDRIASLESGLADDVDVLTREVTHPGIRWQAQDHLDDVWSEP